MKAKNIWLSSFLTPKKISEINTKNYAIDYSNPLNFPDSYYCDTFYAVYKPDKSKRLIKRIPKLKLNLEQFISGLTNIKNVYFFGFVIWKRSMKIFYNFMNIL